VSVNLCQVIALNSQALRFENIGTLNPINKEFDVW